MRTALALFLLAPLAPAATPPCSSELAGPPLVVDKTRLGEVVRTREGEIVRYRHGVEVQASKNNFLGMRFRGAKFPEGFDLEWPDVSEVASGLYVTRNGSTEEYALQNRDLEFYRNVFFGPEWTDPKALAGKRVLDGGCGTRGVAVQELRDAGVDAYGYDIFLGRRQRELPYLFQTDGYRNALGDGQFDVVYLAYGPLTYADQVPRQDQIAFLRENYRLLRPGGSLRISPMSLEHMTDLVKAAGLRRARVSEHRWYDRDKEVWMQAIEVRKVPLWYQRVADAVRSWL